MTPRTVLCSRGPASALLLAVAACSPGRDGSGPSDREPATFLAELIVSNPTTDASALVGDPPSIGASVYLSMRPRTILDGDRIHVVNLRSGATFDAPLVDGSLYPTAITANAGDTLTVNISGGTLRERRRHFSVVPSQRTPLVVRSNPPKGRKDVAPSTGLVVVMSEPLDPRTVIPANVRLLGPPGGLVTAGIVLSQDKLTLAITPSRPLVPSTDYWLQLTASIRDVGGEAPPANINIDFRTDTGPVPPAPPPPPPPPPPPGPGPAPEPVQYGSARITLTATGTNPDPVVRLVLCGYSEDDCYAPYYVGPLSLGQLSDHVVPAGLVHYWVEEVAPNCLRPAPSTLVVQQGVVTTLTISLTCLATARVAVDVLATGPDQPTSYPITVEGWWHYVSAGDLLEIDTYEGTRQVKLEYLPANCQLEGTATRSVTLQPLEVELVQFHVQCQALPIFHLFVQASGSNIPASFTVGIDPDWDYPAGYQSSHVLTPGVILPVKLQVGQHEAWLVGLPPNCTSVGQNPVTASGGVNQVVAVNFGVTCL